MRKEYNMLNAVYQYNLNCVLFDEEKSKEISRFTAREYTELSRTSGFVNGGIASGGQNYMIASTDECLKRAKEMSCLVYVEGVKYRLTNQKISRLNPIRGYSRTGSGIEHVLILE